MTRAEPAGSFRLATYNTRDFLDDAAAAARVVRAIDPDVLCLQEVPRRLLAAWRVASFAEQCRMYWPGHHQGSGGTTIFTSLRVQASATEHRRLSVRPFARRRGYAVTTVAVPGHRPVSVASVHLSLDPSERVEHARLVLDALAGRGDVVVAGDLNEDESGPAYQVLAQRYPRVSAGVPTFPAEQPNRAIDNIFASPGLSVRLGVPAELPEHDVLTASDHRPLWVEIQTRAAKPVGP